MNEQPPVTSAFLPFQYDTTFDLPNKCTLRRKSVREMHRPRSVSLVQFNPARRSWRQRAGSSCRYDAELADPTQLLDVCLPAPAFAKRSSPLIGLRDAAHTYTFSSGRLRGIVLGPLRIGLHDHVVRPLVEAAFVVACEPVCLGVRVGPLPAHRPSPNASRRIAFYDFSARHWKHLRRMIRSRALSRPPATNDPLDELSLERDPRSPWRGKLIETEEFAPL